MSRVVAPMHREEIEVDDRAMTAARRARIIARDGGKCRYPDCEISTGLEVDHIICLELGGKDRDDNLQTLCSEHHKAKTRLDHKLIAKARRRKAKDQGTYPPSRHKLRGRPFPNSREAPR